MNKVIEGFIEETKKKPDVMGIILFGSWARGNNRQSSDVDLIVVLNEGFKRTVEYKDGQAFEITYTTEKSAREYWENHRDDCAGLWEVAKVLYDKDGTIKRLEDFAKEIIKKGKESIGEIEIKHLKFDVEDSLGAIKVFVDNDIVMTNFLLPKKMFDLTELFFDIRQMWVPAPKQRLLKIKDVSQEFYNLLCKFYEDGTSVFERIELFEKAILLVFTHLEVKPPSEG